MRQTNPAPKKGDDPVRDLCDKLRAKGGVEWQTAILADQRVEYVRGKDLAAYFRNHSDEILRYVSRALKPEEQIKVMIELLQRRRLLVKADRVFKKPRPGKKRLAKWPKKLQPLNDATFEEEFFYAWQYERPSSPYLFLFSTLLVVVVILFCLFPLAPQPIKLAVVYLSMALLIAIAIVILVRTLLASVTWITLGRALWLFPHLLADDKGLNEAFWPILQLEEEDKDKNQWTHGAMRFGVALSMIGMSYALYHNVPDKGAALGGARHAHDAILDMLNLHGGGLSLTSNATGPGTQNATTGKEL